MELQGVNVTRLSAVLAHIAKHPGQWDQNTLYSTSTGARCFASWTVSLAGDDLHRWLARTEPTTIIYHRAATLLGLTTTQSRALFRYACTPLGEHPTLAEFRARITQFTGIEFPDASDR